jgi:hypothetical protein
MVRRAAFVLALASFLLPLTSLFAMPPRPAPPVYATAIYGLTFRTPPGLTYCPLPRDWVGSDHRTVLFLESPGNCGGAGYPSSSRSFQRNAARIELFYEYVVWDNPKRPARCAGARVRFIGQLRAICFHRDGAMVRASLETWYVSDRHMEHDGIPSQASLTLVTRPERLRRDLVVFRRLAASLRTCSSLWPGVDGHPAHVSGVGARCGDVGTF